jgi:hypothetical protein
MYKPAVLQAAAKKVSNDNAVTATNIENETIQTVEIETPVSGEATREKPVSNLPTCKG